MHDDRPTFASPRVSLLLAHGRVSHLAARSLFHRTARPRRRGRRYLRLPAFRRRKRASAKIREVYRRYGTLVYRNTCGSHRRWRAHCRTRGRYKNASRLCARRQFWHSSATYDDVRGRPRLGRCDPMLLATLRGNVLAIPYTPGSEFIFGG